MMELTRSNLILLSVMGVMVMGYFGCVVLSLWGMSRLISSPRPVEPGPAVEELAKTWLTDMVAHNCVKAGAYMQPGFEEFTKYCGNKEMWPMYYADIQRSEIRACTSTELEMFSPSCTPNHRIVKLWGEFKQSDYGNYSWYEIQVIKIGDRWYIDEPWDRGR